MEALWDALVPSVGQADTVQGEMVRALGRISNDYFCNGSSNWDESYEMLSNFLLNQLRTQSELAPSMISAMKQDISAFQSYGRGNDIGEFDLGAAFERLATTLVAWCETHPKPIPLASSKAVPLTSKKKASNKRSATDPIEPTNAILTSHLHGVEVILIDFEAALTRLKPEEYLARFNRVRVQLISKMNPHPSLVFLSVFRHGTLLGNDNFCTVPLHVPELAKLGDCVYDVFSFDAFNLPFESISVNLTTPQQLEKRRIGQAHITRAHEHTQFVMAPGAA